MKYVVTYEQGDQVSATIMTERQKSECRSTIVEALQVEDDKAAALLSRVKESLKEGATPKSSSPAIGSF